MWFAKRPHGTCCTKPVSHSVFAHMVVDWNRHATCKLYWGAVLERNVTKNVTGNGYRRKQFLAAGSTNGVEVKHTGKSPHFCLLHLLSSDWFGGYGYEWLVFPSERPDVTTIQPFNYSQCWTYIIVEFSFAFTSIHILNDTPYHPLSVGRQHLITWCPEFHPHQMYLISQQGCNATSITGSTRLLVWELG